MSRRKTKEEEQAEFDAECAREDARRQVQAECCHFDCQPTRWYWSGRVEEMTCNKCGLTKWFTDEKEQCDEQ